MKAPLTLAGMIVLLAACTTAPPMPDVGASHPASPRATEAPVPSRSDTLRFEPQAEPAEAPTDKPKTQENVPSHGGGGS